ncbi:Xylose isomerase domain protein TIM barrel [Methanococcus vannielii SB]|uniref:Xylose isomerase domain protein TIM barrel n=2 Tax=Methanococcus vannielii TaxID=2187 RepID=A6UR97_METVS|nr:Xylose isomerase domain protein TIM barrel [Methanococcus vannielii SB]
MRLKNPENNFKFTDWGFHFCETIKNDLEDSICGFHAPIVDIGTSNNNFGIEKLKNIIDSIPNADYLTIHLHNGLKPDYDTLLNNVSELTDYAKKSNIVLCIENLRYGFSANPENVINIADFTDCDITFDIGHVCYEKRQEYVDIFSDRIYNVHVYELENETGHVAPKDLKNLTPILDKLLNVGANQWLIELMDIGEIKHTELLLHKYIKEHK